MLNAELEKTLASTWEFWYCAETSEESGDWEQLPHARGSILTPWYWLSVPVEFKVYLMP